jgi:hypothetical protein
MRRGVRIPAWYLLLVAVLVIMCGCQSLRDLERFAIRHHSVLSEALGIELRLPPSDSFRYFFRQVDVRLSTLPFATGLPGVNYVGARLPNCRRAARDGAFCLGGCCA